MSKLKKINFLDKIKKNSFFLKIKKNWANQEMEKNIYMLHKKIIIIFKILIFDIGFVGYILAKIKYNSGQN